MKLINKIRGDFKYYRRSYMFVVYKSFFDLVIQGKVKIDDIIRCFRDFYLARKQQDLKVEVDNAATEVIDADEHNLDRIKSYVMRVPLDKINSLQQKNNFVVMKEELWSELTKDDIFKIRNYINQKLIDYFDEKLDGYNMAIPNVSGEKVIQALEEFDEKYRGGYRWDNFIEKKNHKYAIKYQNKCYPVKKVISLATGVHISTFSGGNEANDYIRKLGFEIIDLEEDKIKNQTQELILKSEINWSMFKWGLTIPVKLHDKFYEANNKQLASGENQEITFLINDNEYNVSLRNIDNRSKSETLQIRYDGNEKLKELLKKKFEFSYEYITTERQKQIKNGKQRPQIKLPEDKKEYIKIYSTGEPYKFEVELETISRSLRDKFNKIMANYLQARINEQFAGHQLGDLFRHELPNMLQDYITNFVRSNNEYRIKGSIGQGNWARVPWIAIMDKDVTETTREGVYVTYLFSEDMESLYLTLMQGVSNSNKTELVNKREKYKENLDLRYFETDRDINLSDHKRGQEYEAATIGYLKYEKDRLPDETILINDLETALEIYQKYKNKYLTKNLDEVIIKENRQLYETDGVNNIVEQIEKYIASKGFNYPNGLIKNFYLSLKTKPFVLLAGISGTGKTKLAKLFAEAIGCTRENRRFQIIPVRPDWNDTSDLLGYNNLQDEFNPGPMIDIIKRANEDRENPYLVCLDEMNLARVEYYFSDLLSIMETREKTGDKITSEVLLENEYFNNDKGRKKYGNLRLPDNLYIIGTVNMDETTHPFSKKVLDRANTIEFSKINLNSFNLSTEHREAVGDLSNNFLNPEYVTLNHCSEEDKELIQKVVDRLIEINNILKQGNLQVGYRVRDEICFYMLYNDRYNLLDFNLAFDFQFMQKILPRIQGSSRLIKELLVNLFTIASGQDYSTTDGRIGNQIVKYVNDVDNDVGPYPKSAKKLAYMIQRFEKDGFTSFWL